VDKKGGTVEILDTAKGVPKIQLGLLANWQQFTLLVLVNAFAWLDHWLACAFSHLYRAGSCKRPATGVSSERQQEEFTKVQRHLISAEADFQVFFHS
jgi:hypothetical protein